VRHEPPGVTPTEASREPALSLSDGPLRGAQPNGGLAVGVGGFQGNDFPIRARFIRIRGKQGWEQGRGRDAPEAVAKKLFHVPRVAGVPTRHPARPLFSRRVGRPAAHVVKQPLRGVPGNPLPCGDPVRLGPRSWLRLRLRPSRLPRDSTTRSGRSLVVHRLSPCRPRDLRRGLRIPLLPRPSPRRPLPLQGIRRRGFRGLRSLSPCSRPLRGALPLPML